MPRRPHWREAKRIPPRAPTSPEPFPPNPFAVAPCPLSSLVGAAGAAAVARAGTRGARPGAKATPTTAQAPPYVISDWSGGPFFRRRLVVWECSSPPVAFSPNLNDTSLAPPVNDEWISRCARFFFSRSQFQPYTITRLTSMTFWCDFYTPPPAARSGLVVKARRWVWFTSPPPIRRRCQQANMMVGGDEIVFQIPHRRAPGLAAAAGPGALGRESSWPRGPRGPRGGRRGHRS